MVNFTKYLQKYADIQPRTYWWEFSFYTIITSARQKFCLGNRPEDLDKIATIEQRTWEKHLAHLNRLERFPLDKAENASVCRLNRVIKKTLEGTNWRLMSEGVNYGLGYLSGRLKGYEQEEDLLQLVKKNKEQSALAKV